MRFGLIGKNLQMFRELKDISKLYYKILFI